MPHTQGKRQTKETSSWTQPPICHTVLTCQSIPEALTAPEILLLKQGHCSTETYFRRHFLKQVRTMSLALRTGMHGVPMVSSITYSCLGALSDLGDPTCPCVFMLTVLTECHSGPLLLWLKSIYLWEPSKRPVCWALCCPLRPCLSLSLTHIQGPFRILQLAIVDSCHCLISLRSRQGHEHANNCLLKL